MNLSSIRENTKLAMETLVAHKFRATLTILGVFIGVLVIVAMAAVLNGFRQTVLDNAESFGTRNVYVWRWPFIPTGKLSPEVLNRKPLSYEDAMAIEEGAPAVEHVYPGLVYGIPEPGGMPPVPPEVKYRDRVMSRPRVMGTFPVGEIVMNLKLGSGRFINDVETRHRAYVCTLGFNVTEALFPAEDPVGKVINVGGQEFTVVGTAAKLKAGPFGSENPDDNNIYIPYWTFRKMYPNIEDHFIILRMREGMIKEGIDQMEQVLRRRRNVPLHKDNDFEIGTPESFISTFDDIVGAVFGVMLIISSIAFMVGGVGVMNIMLVAVTERTKEIGIRKAVGAKRSDIIWQFLTEAMALTGTGGMAGLMFGWFLSWLVTTLAPALTMKIPLWAAAFGFFGSVAVGVIFGLWPAVKAARLDPITALRYE
jgi:putative ABC transport system permease protein